MSMEALLPDSANTTLREELDRIVAIAVGDKVDFDAEGGLLGAVHRIEQLLGWRR